MEKVLYLNACVRKESRTNRLARFVLERLPERAQITELCLVRENIAPLDEELLRQRDALAAAGEFEHPSLRYARQLAEAETLVIAAPYWDLSFPAALKVYLERATVTGITFRYAENGSLQSLCAAKKLIFVTTAGGPIFEPNLGYAWVRQQAEVFWGVQEFAYYKAEGLDIMGADVEKILRQVEAEISQNAKSGI